MIKNPSNFTNNKKSHDALKILNEGLIHANPQIGLQKYFFRNKIKTKNSIINLKNFENVYVIAIGKAADSMMKFVSSKIAITKGIIIMPSNYKPIFKQNKIS